MHLKAISGGIKAREMGAQAVMKTAGKAVGGGRFGETLRALVGGAAGAAAGTVSEPAAKPTVAQQQGGDAKTQIPAASAETEADGEARGLEAATAPQDVAAARAAATMVPADGSGKGVVAGSGAGLNWKTAKSDKGLPTASHDGATKVASAPGSAVMDGAADTVAAVPAGVSATAPVQVPVAPKMEVAERSASETPSVAGAGSKTGAVKARKAAFEAKDEAVAEKPAAAAGSAVAVAQSHVVGQVAAAKDSIAVEVHAKSGDVAGPVAPVALSVGAAPGVQGAGHAAKPAASVAGAAPRGMGGADEVKTLAATPNVLEVGLSDGTHGWLKVRAQVGQGGEIAASLVTASAGQAEVLRRELPAISTYLAGESVEVSSVVVEAPAQAAGPGTGAQDGGASAGGLMQGGQASDGGSDGREDGGAKGGAAGLVEQDVVQGMWFNEVAPAAALGGSYGSGRWLSVVA